jgi:hypothetical protein
MIKIIKFLKQYDIAFRIAICLSLFCAYANAAPVSLHLVYPQTATLENPVTVQFSLKKNILHVDFEVHAPEIYAKKVLGALDYPYNYDVVEIFIAAKMNEKNLPLPYYEFELSPLNQTYEVKVIKPLKETIHDMDTGMTHQVKRFPGGWKAEMDISLDKLGWNGNPCQIVGNVFAIVGKQPRTYWSLYLPPELSPNFHKPEYFQPLFCK